MGNTVKVQRTFSGKDFKPGAYVTDAEYPGTDPDVYYVVASRDDGILDLILIAPPFTTRHPHAEDMEPFYGTVTIESKP